MLWMTIFFLLFIRVSEGPPHCTHYFNEILGDKSLLELKFCGCKKTQLDIFWFCIWQVFIINQQKFFEWNFNDFFFPLFRLHENKILGKYTWNELFAVCKKTFRNIA